MLKSTTSFLIYSLKMINIIAKSRMEFIVRSIKTYDKLTNQLINVMIVVSFAFMFFHTYFQVSRIIKKLLRGKVEYL